MNDRQLEIMVGILLRTGVLLAAGIVTLGGLLYLAQHHGDPVAYQHFVAGGSDTRTLAGIVKSAAHFDSAAIIQFGLLLLIATPVARVVMAMVGFALERDRLYVVVSLIVLVVLVASLVHAT